MDGQVKRQLADDVATLFISHCDLSVTANVTIITLTSRFLGKLSQKLSLIF